MLSNLPGGVELVSHRSNPNRRAGCEIISANTVSLVFLCRQVCSSALADPSELEVASAAFKATAALLQTIPDEQAQARFQPLLPQILHVSA